MTRPVLVVGVDLGATNIRAAVGQSDGTLTATSQTTTPQGDEEGVVTAVRTVVADAMDTAGVDRGDIEAAGIGSMGPLDHEAGAVVDPPNVARVDQIPVASAVEDAVDAPVTLRNDATAGAIGVQSYAGGAPSNLVYVTISSGLGAGAIVDGRPLIGEKGNAAEAGHFTLAPDSEVACSCGGTGHWEGFCSGENLPEYARHLAHSEGITTELPLSDLSASQIFASSPDDPLARTVLERFGEWNTLGTAALVHAYDPAVVVFGGGVALPNPDAVLEPVRAKLPDAVVGTPPAVRLTTLGDQTVLRGAVATALAERDRGTET